MATKKRESADATAREWQSKYGTTRLSKSHPGAGYSIDGKPAEDADAKAATAQAIAANGAIEQAK